MCETNTLTVNSELTYEEASISLDFCNERNGRIKGNFRFSRSEQPVFGDGSFGPSKAERLSLVLVEGNGGVFWITQVLLLFHLSTQSKMNMSGEFSFDRYFEKTAPIDMFDRVLNCLCLRRATDDEIGHMFLVDFFLLQILLKLENGMMLFPSVLYGPRII